MNYFIFTIIYPMRPHKLNMKLMIMN